MKNRIGILLLVIAFPLFAQTRVPDAAQFVGAPAGQPLGGATLERKTAEVSALLRCPVCQGLAVADSPAEMAINMRRQVHDLLSRGYTEQQILSYFEQSYGEFVLLRPKFEGLNAMVWLLPLLVLIAGSFVVFFKMKKLHEPATHARQQSTDDKSPAADPYLAQVRQLVDGEKK